MNCEDDKFIHYSSFSFNEVKQLLIQAQIIIVNSYSVLYMYDTWICTALALASQFSTALLLQKVGKDIFKLGMEYREGRKDAD
jgi:hypothetical protein